MSTEETKSRLDPNLFENSLFDDDEPDQEGSEGGFEESDSAAQSEEVEDSGEGADNVDSSDVATDEPAEDTDADDGAEEGTEEDDLTDTSDPTDSDDADDDDADDTGDDEDADADADDQMMGGPTKRRRGRPPKKKSEPSADGEEPLTRTYVVQRGLVAEGGKTYHAGDVIPVKCKFCALWKVEWLGKVRCYPGKEMMDGSTMSADRYSCETFFVPKELDAELKNFLNMPVHEVQLVRRMIPGLKRLFDAINWMHDYAERHNITGDIEEAKRNARGLTMAFDSVEQIRYMEEFIRLYANAFAKKVREKRPPRPVYRGGDWVEWTDVQTHEKYEGIILGKGKGKITIAGVRMQQGTRFTFNFKEWVRKTSPKITRHSADSE